jgi:transposase-like protein
VYSDTFASYDALSAEGYEHVRINHSEELAAEGGRHINGIENFWGQAKRHLSDSPKVFDRRQGNAETGPRPVPFAPRRGHLG